MKLFRRILSAGVPGFRRPAPAAARGTPLATIVSPQARDRWISASVKQFTPERVEHTLRSAMSGNLVAQWELFDLMEATWPRLQKNLTELKRAVIALDWNLQTWAAGDAPPSGEATRRKALVEELVWSMRPRPDADENDFEGTIRDVMDAWGKGIAVLEIDWALAESRFSNSKLQMGPRATRWVHPRCYGYPNGAAWLGLNTREEGVDLKGSGERRTLNAEPGTLKAAGLEADFVDGFARFPADKFLIAVAKQKSGHPAGAALLRPLAYWWCASNFTAEWLLNFAQIFGQPIRWATYDTAKPGLLEAVSEMLENMGSAGWAAMPAGTRLELKEAVRSGQDNPQALVFNLADRICDILVLGQTLTTDVGDSGSRALGSVHQSVRDEVIQSAADWVAGILNSQLAPAILRLNFGDDTECPWFMPARKQAHDAKAMAERDQILLQAGVALPKTWFHERHDIPLPAAGEETIRAGGGEAAKPAKEQPAHEDTAPIPPAPRG